MPKFLYFRLLWLTDMGWPDISFGLHICMSGRVDFHFLKWILSVGRVPIYQMKNGKRFAASNSYYENRSKEFRAGTPNHI